MSETFPISLKLLLGYMVSDEIKFFQNLHSRRDSRLQYQPWQVNSNRIKCYHRTVTFNTVQAPITVEVNQEQTIFRCKKFVISIRHI